MDGMERRLEALESGVRFQVPPPVITPPREVHYNPAPIDRTPQDAQDDTEYYLGAKVLPRVGAGVLVLGIGYLVSLAISRGLLGPWALFGLAVALCVVLIAIGQWKRDEREQFGELLTGAGVSGLYVTFTAGHVFQHLYPGETLVALFLGLSLASLIYSFGRKSRAFLGIGVTGGFAAALLPLRSDAFQLMAILHATVLLISVAIAARHRWSESVLAVATGGFCVALVLAFGVALAVPYGIGLIYLSSLALLVGWSRIPANAQTPFVAAPCVFIAACFAYGAMDKLAGSQHVLASMSAHLVVTALLFRKGETRNLFLAAATAAIVTLVPIGLPTAPSVLAYPAVALTAALVGARLGSYAIALGVLAFTCGILRYLAMHFFGPFPSWLEPTYLSLAAVSAVGLGFAARDRDAEATGWGFALLALGRLGFMQLTGPLGMTENVAWTTLLIVLSLAFMALGFLRDLSPLRYASFFGLAATVAKVLLIDLAETSSVVRVVILMILGLVLIGGGYVYIWQRRSRERTDSV